MLAMFTPRTLAGLQFGEERLGKQEGGAQVGPEADFPIVGLDLGGRAQPLLSGVFCETGQDVPAGAEAFRAQCLADATGGTGKGRERRAKTVCSVLPARCSLPFSPLGADETGEEFDGLFAGTVDGLDGVAGVVRAEENAFAKTAQW